MAIDIKNPVAVTHRNLPLGRRGLAQNEGAVDWYGQIRKPPG